MTIVVQKFGGSSVADLARIGRVADRVVATLRSGVSVCVVVSAMGKTTDQLLAMAREVSSAAPRRELDMLLSVGERTTMALLAIALHARGADAISFTGSQSGIITNDRHFDARIIEVRPFRIEDELSRGRVVIVAGYQGMSYRREITTLGRGGSDTTAVALAAALGAQRCEIYSDVDGVYSADPRVVPGARHLSELGHEELQGMADAGAKVLNAEAVEFARREKIAIYARKTDDPWEGARETVVRANAPRGASGVRAVVGDKNLAGVVFDAGDLARVLAGAHAAGVSFQDLRSEGGRSRAVVSLARVSDWARAERELTELGARCSREHGTVTLVGSGLHEDPGVLLGAIEVAGAIGASAAGVECSGFKAVMTVEVGDVDALTRALHTRFCEDGAAR